MPKTAIEKVELSPLDMAFIEGEKLFLKSILNDNRINQCLQDLKKIDKSFIEKEQASYTSFSKERSFTADLVAACFSSYPITKLEGLFLNKIGKTLVKQLENRISLTKEELEEVVATLKFEFTNVCKVHYLFELLTSDDRRGMYYTCLKGNKERLLIDTLLSIEPKGRKNLLNMLIEDFGVPKDILCPQASVFRNPKSAPPYKDSATLQRKGKAIEDSIISEKQAESSQIHLRIINDYIARSENAKKQITDAVTRVKNATQELIYESNKKELVSESNQKELNNAVSRTKAATEELVKVGSIAQKTWCEKHQTKNHKSGTAQPPRY